MNALIILVVCVASSYAQSYGEELCPVGGANMTDKIRVITELKEALTLELEDAKKDLFYVSEVLKGKRYLLSKEPLLDVSKALEYCTLFDGYLAEIIDLVEHELVMEFLYSIPLDCRSYKDIRVSGLYDLEKLEYFYHGTTDFSHPESIAFRVFNEGYPLEQDTKLCLALEKGEPSLPYLYKNIDCFTPIEPYTHFMCELDVKY